MTLFTCILTCLPTYVSRYSPTCLPTCFSTDPAATAATAALFRPGASAAVPATTAAKFYQEARPLPPQGQQFSRHIQQEPDRSTTKVSYRMY